MKHSQKKYEKNFFLSNKKKTGKTCLLSIGLLLFYASLMAQNTNFGINSLANITGGGANAAFGFEALLSVTNGSFNTATGWGALRSNLANNNTATGWGTLFVNATGDNNTAVGSLALRNNTSGDANTAIGANALFNNTIGNNNTALGNGADVLANNLTNATAIGNGAIVNGSNAIQLGNGNVTQVFAGVGNTATLITGGLQVTTNPTLGHVLTSDGAGVATWQPLPASGAGWALTGNAGTVDGTNFIGTTDNVPFNIRVNDQRAGRIEFDVTANTFYGYQSGNSNTTGIFNTAIGHSALFSNTTGQGNTVSGFWSLYANTTGNGNTATGTYVLSENTEGGGNTGTGYGSLNKNQTGNGNTATGASALSKNTVGNDNTANGKGALNKNTIGYENTATGAGALQNNEAGNYNTANGFVSLDFNTSGNYNTANGHSALYNNGSGNNNTADGWAALCFNTTGSNNTALGYLANVSFGSNFTNATAIGANATVNASNKVRIGDGTVTVIEGQVAFTNTSDGRFKTNISEDDVKGLEFIKKLRPVVYNFDTKKFEEFLTKNMPDSIRGKYMGKDFAPSTAIRQSGFIAQEVEKAAKEIGYNFNGVHVPENDNDNYSLAYSQFVVPLVKAVQEQQQTIERLQQQMEELKKLVSALTTSPAEPIKTTGAKTGYQAKDLESSVSDDSGDIKVYPNPSTGIVTVAINYPDAVEMEVYTMSGNRIYQTELKANTSNYRLDLSAYPSGMYLLRISSKGKEITTKKLIIK